VKEFSFGKYHDLGRRGGDLHRTSSCSRPAVVVRETEDHCGRWSSAAQRKPHPRSSLAQGLGAPPAYPDTGRGVPVSSAIRARPRGEARSTPRARFADRRGEAAPRGGQDAPFAAESCRPRRGGLRSRGATDVFVELGKERERAQGPSHRSVISEYRDCAPVAHRFPKQTETPPAAFDEVGKIGTGVERSAANCQRIGSGGRRVHLTETNPYGRRRRSQAPPVAIG